MLPPLLAFAPTLAPEFGENLVDYLEEEVDPGLTLATTPGLVNKAYRLASESSSVLKYIGNFTGLYSIYHNGAKSLSEYQNGHYVAGSIHAVESIGQAVIMGFGGEEIELGWNAGTLLFDSIFDK